MGGKDDEVWGDLKDFMIFNCVTETIHKGKHDKSKEPFTAGQFPCVKVAKDRVIAVDSKSLHLLEYQHDSRFFNKVRYINELTHFL